MSKGSNRRPSHIKDSELEDNWSRIFGNKDHYNYLLNDKDGFEDNHMFGKKPAKDNKPMPGKKGKKC